MPKFEELNKFSQLNNATGKATTFFFFKYNLL